MSSPPPAATAKQNPPLLHAKRIVKRFGGVTAVDGVSFELQRGEILGVIGPNGAGKSTLFDCLAGSHLPDEGSIFLNAQPIGYLAAWKRVSKGLTRTFQIPRPFPAMTVLENVMLGSQTCVGERILPNWLQSPRVRREERAARDKAMDLLDFVTLRHLADEPARILSGGQRKLLELARALMADPALILLDEPAAGVNPVLVDVIIDRLIAMNRQGTTLLLIEHDMDMVARLCGRVLVMAAGQVLTEGTPEGVTRDRRVIEAYLGDAPP
jgi:branched-chain amino acid transport system ATP-binding protein